MSSLGTRPMGRVLVGKAIKTGLGSGLRCGGGGCYWEIAGIDGYGLRVSKGRCMARDYIVGGGRPSSSTKAVHWSDSVVWAGRCRAAALIVKSTDCVSFRITVQILRLKVHSTCRITLL